MRPAPAVLGTLVALLVLPATAVADDPPYVPWSSLLPGLSGGYEPSSADDCRAGRIKCVDHVIREMDRRFDGLAGRCDHDASFALGYLRTTEEYRRAAVDPGFFSDPGFVNHEDVVFARYYVEAYDDWHGGRRSQVPAAWQVAFDAADDRRMPASGNFILGMNAHIARDLPFVLAEIGLVTPEGGSRKADHDRVNRFLNRVADDFIPELARRLDPTADDSNLPTAVDDVLTFQIVPAWRERAWRDAERLVAAPTTSAWEAVADGIEAYAATQARSLATASAYGPGQSSAARDAFCQANG